MTKSTFIKATLALLINLSLVSSIHSQGWRSTLYPNNWSPPTNKEFLKDKLIQDMSYAGFKRGESGIPNTSGPIYDVTKSPYNADKTGSQNVTAKIQDAINDASVNGGGVVFLPAGTYKVQPPNGKDYCLRIASSKVVLRGAGEGSTFIFNNSNQMRQKAIIRVENANDWGTSGGNKTNITQNLLKPTRVIPVQSTSGYSSGNIIIIKVNINSSWTSDNSLGSSWPNSGGAFPTPIYYCRQVTSVNSSAKTITIDIPIRHTIKTSYNPEMYKASSMLREVGIENLSIGNKQSGKSGYNESDWQNSSKGAFDCHDSWAIDMKGTYNSWIKDVSSYKPSGNSSNAHVLSNGILLDYCKNVTIEGCDFRNPQYGGGGGNGYMYRIQSNECLIKDSKARFSRHGFVLARARASGNVFHNCEDRDTGKSTGLNGNTGTSGKSSDHHMHFSHSNLFDKTTVTNSWLQAKWRPFGSNPKHNLTGAHTIFWNTTSNGSQSIAIETQQGRYGYGIGTSGNKATIKTTGFSNTQYTNPTDHKEGQGIGSTLVPQSLYLDQLFRRTGIVVSTEHPIPGKVEAEDYSAQSGVQTQATSDVGGGDNVGFIATGDWMDYEVNVATSGNYDVSFRVAANTNNIKFDLKKGSSILTSVNSSPTGEFQTWKTVTKTVTLSAGKQTLRIAATGSSWNINWMDFEPSSGGGGNTEHPIPGKVEAEDYSAQSGVQTQATSDVGGGDNVGFIATGDWMDYEVNVATSGNYDVSFRVAANTSNIRFDLKKGSSILTSVNSSPTGGFQTWKTVTKTVTLSAGEQTLRIAATGSSWNINWMDFESSSGGGGGSVINLALNKSVTVSSQQSGNTGNKAVDGIANSDNNRWSASPMPQWLEVDLGAVYDISKTEVIAYSGRAYRFTIQAKTSSNGSFTTIVNRSNNTKGGTASSPITDNFSPVAARYVRINVTGASGYSGSWASLREFRVFGDPSSNLGGSAPVTLAVVKEDVSIYPNPAEDLIRITGLSLGVPIIITDLSGRTVIETYFEEKEIDISRLAKGVYIVRSKDFTTKFVKN